MNLDQFEPLAVAGYRRNGNNVFDDFLPALNSRQGRRTLRQMADNDETIGSVLLALETIYRSVEMHVDDNENDTDGKYAEWLSNALFNEMGDPRSPLPDDTWSAFSQSWVDSDIFGFQWYDVWVKKLTDGSIGIARFVPVDAETVDGWDIEEPSGYVSGIYQDVNGQGRIRIGRERSLHIVSSVNKSSPEGKSLLRTAYRLWYYKKMYLEIEAILAERGAGFPVLYVNSDIQKLAGTPIHDKMSDMDKAKINDAQAMMSSFETLVSNIKRNEQSGAVIYTKPYTSHFDPETGVRTYGGQQQVELKLLTPDQSGSSDIDRSIKRLDTGIARALLADFLFFGTNGNTGNQSNLSTRSELWQQSVEARVKNIVECINRQVIPQLWKLNAFPEDMKPTLRAGKIAKEAFETLVNALQRLSAAGAPVFPDTELQKHIYGEMGLPTNGILEESDRKLPNIED
ncbi:portal protein [Proteus phage vB_PmiS_PM-CJR]|nr:portal protein [Proteus phage vB_PmiS_PM-CJR]